MITDRWLTACGLPHQWSIHIHRQKFRTVGNLKCYWCSTFQNHSPFFKELPWPGANILRAQKLSKACMCLLSDISISPLVLFPKWIHSSFSNSRGTEDCPQSHTPCTWEWYTWLLSTSRSPFQLDCLTTSVFPLTSVWLLSEFNWIW
jgi:hypothetical protein